MPDRPVSFDAVGSAGGTLFELPLFPLRTVLFPDGLLPLKVFEARYLDLVTRCLRSRDRFGVVALREGSEAGVTQAPTLFERVGTMAELVEVDSPQGGLLVVRCRGTDRFRIASFHRQDDGLWVASAERLPADATAPVPASLARAAVALQQAIEGLAAQGARPFLEPYRLDDAGWVANRWCELLPIPLAAKQRLMELADPVARLDLVDDYLRGRQVIERDDD